MKVLSVIVGCALITGVQAQTRTADCVAANTPGGYILLSGETMPKTPDASRPTGVGAGCRPDTALPATRNSGPGEVRVSTLAASKEAQKAFEKAQRSLGRQDPNYAEAARQLEKALKSSPSFALAWDLLGVVRNRQGEEGRATEAFENAIRADPGYLTPHLRLAAMAVLRNRMEEALRISGVILRLKPGLREALDYRAVACYSLGQRECAAQSARAVLNTGPDSLYPRLHLILGDILAGQEEYGPAAAEYRRLIELIPGSPAAIAAGLLISDWKTQGIIPQEP